MRQDGAVTPSTGRVDRPDAAAVREDVRRVARVTPLVEAAPLGERVGRPVLLKLECLQVTDSFKIRGAAARLAALTPEERAGGVAACSSGNHGRATAWAASHLGVPARIYVPEWVDPVKLEGIRAQGAEAVLAGATFDEAEARARAEAARDGRVYVSAYDDPWVIAGQGTIALEVLDALDGPPAAFLAPLSGGGLIGGMAEAFRARRGPDAPAAVAVSAERAAVMLASLRAGRPVELPEEETLASALAGGIGLDNRWSFDLVRTVVDEHHTVTEDEITAAMRFAYNELGLIVEGGGAVGLALLLAGRWRPPAGREGPVVVVVSGGNVAPETLRGVLRG